jgi:transposase
MLYAGMDIHKVHCHAILMTKDGEVVKEERIKSNKEEIKDFFAGFNDVNIAFEATTNYEYFYDLLEGLGYKPLLSHPYKTRLIAESMIKTDKIDARALAHLLRTDLLPLSYVPPKEIRELRHLVRHRIFLGRHRAKIKNQIHAKLFRNNLNYNGPNLFSKQGMKWLHGLGIIHVNSYLNIFKAIEEEIKTIELKIKFEGSKYKEVLQLTTIPGIGIYSALIIFSEIGDISRFHSEESLYNYAGIIPRVHQSGEKKYHGRITKEGSRYLRWILAEIIRVHITWAPESKITKYYYRIKKKKNGNVAAIAASRKLLQTIYHMLKDKKDYQG